MDEEYEADLQSLESMCTELLEPALLVDKEHKIIWINAVLKELVNIQKNSEIFVSSKEFLNTQVSECIISNELKDSLNAAFSKGKLCKFHETKSKEYIKGVVIPIKYLDNTIYALTILETEELADTAKTINECTNWVRFLLDEYDGPSMIVDVTFKPILFNKEFERVFKSNIVRNFVLENIKHGKYGTYLRNNELLNFKYSIAKKPITDATKIVGYFICFSRVKNDLRKTPKQNQKISKKKSKHDNKKSD